MYTTSRYASPETRKFASSLAKDEATIYVARGKKTIGQMAEYARRNGHEDIFIVEERDDKPAKIARIRVLETGAWEWAGERVCSP